MTETEFLKQYRQMSDTDQQEQCEEIIGLIEAYELAVDYGLDRKGMFDEDME